MSHLWPLDFEGYRDSLSVLSDEHQDRRDANEELRKIRESLLDITRCVKEYFPKLAGANGLDLSVYTLRNIQRIFAGDPIERLSPGWFTAALFQSALGIPGDLAIKMDRLFRDGVATHSEVSKLPAMTPEILNRFERTFQLDDAQPDPESRDSVNLP